MLNSLSLFGKVNLYFGIILLLLGCYLLVEEISNSTFRFPNSFAIVFFYFRNIYYSVFIYVKCY